MLLISTASCNYPKLVPIHTAFSKSTSCCVKTAVVAVTLRSSSCPSVTAKSSTLCPKVPQAENGHLLQDIKLIQPSKFYSAPNSTQIPPNHQSLKRSQRFPQNSSPLAVCKDHAIELQNLHQNVANGRWGELKTTLRCTQSILPALEREQIPPTSLAASSASPCRRAWQQMTNACHDLKGQFQGPSHPTHGYLVG